MKRILVISDIHGELELFNRLLAKVDYDGEKDQLILLGDYVDRGPDAKGVISTVMALKEQGAIVLRGNHEEMLLAAVDDLPDARERWNRNGALHTLQSYNSTIDGMEVPDDEVFEQHVAFIRELDYYFETDHYIFVHAGVDPEVYLVENDAHTLVWIREAFHRHYHGNKTVIFGHTPTAYFHGEGTHDVYYGENRIIGIDGGAVFGGQLNCLELETRRVYSVKSDKD